ncbi:MULTISPECIES: hypothetical protein [Burkholderia]|uniref:Uncharacterized protein n=1 Tax=Burkholderia mayonis TaxID=1385591 RepID=A0A1B4FL37_9BURK|nr:MULTISPECIES: hypothetical protein [Burkholderia]AOJ04362.1 hypothetical protein WS70_21175 [Burkholderia mayonis]KVE49637.1 hypothetical protein WS70_19610 [Burkholderia mayonis]
MDRSDPAELEREEEAGWAESGSAMLERSVVIVRMKNPAHAPPERRRPALCAPAGCGSDASSGCAPRDAR